MKKPDLIQRAIKLQWFLIIYNIVEAVASIIFGIRAESIALIGFGLDSVIEVSAAGIVLWHLSYRGTQAEESAKAKKALFFVGITFFLLAFYILCESGSKLIHSEKPEVAVAGIIIAALSLILMPTIGIFQKRIAKAIGSRALEADATETIICAYLSLTLLLGLGLNALFGWWWADPVTALAMVYFIVKEGIEAVQEARE